MENSLKRILSISLLLIFIGSFTIIFVGKYMSSVNNEIKELNLFMTEAKSIQPNFEKSLEIYTDTTEEVIKYLLSLRPHSEEEFVKFISEVEDIGQELLLNINLTSLVSKDDSKKDNKNTIKYIISFFGDISDIQNFIERIEQLPYYIKIDQVDFQSASNPEKDTKQKLENIKIIISLYIK